MENNLVDRVSLLASKFKKIETLEMEIKEIDKGLQNASKYANGDLIAYIAMGKKRENTVAKEPASYEEYIGSITTSPYINIGNIPLLKLEYITLVLIALKRYVSEEIIIEKENIQKLMSSENSALFNNFSKLHNVKERSGLNGVKESHAPSEYVAQVTVKKKVKEELAKLKTPTQWNKVYKESALNATKINRLVDYKIEKLNLEDLQTADNLILDEGFVSFLKFVNTCKTRRRKDN